MSDMGNNRVTNEDQIYPDKTNPAQIKIRQAQPLDVSNLVRLLDQSITDDGNGYPPPDYYMAINWVTSILNEGYVVVAEKSGRLIGTIAVTNFRFPWSPRWFLYVDWMFVSRNFREGGVFAGLMKVIHAYADDRGAPIWGGISSGKDATLKDRLMRMSGYQYLGGQFIREPETKDGQRQEDNEPNSEVHPAVMD
jgi:GNAT superfamily N-acetyltransferase